MACLDMCNNSSNPAAADNATAKYFSAARISFSNDFVESSTQHATATITARAPASFDFEFSVTNHSMMSAEELMFKGQMLPFKDAGGGTGRKATTLREEILAGDEENGDVTPKGLGPTRWKGFLGLRKVHIESKTVVGPKLSARVITTAVAQEKCKTPQKTLDDKRSNLGDVAAMEGER